MSAQHTPTPWHQSSTSETMVLDDDGIGVCDCLPSAATSVREGPANAAFIVRACNAHAELVAALRRANDWISETKAKDPSLCAESTLAWIRAALAKAGMA